MKCCICKGEIENKGYWDKGNNALPVKDGRCCDKCNMTVVLPERFKKVSNEKTE
tara:strand:- start:1130 stop:1291 length:162 start_codon:yes stop_codon:yes gene_type:complete